MIKVLSLQKHKEKYVNVREHFATSHHYTSMNVLNIHIQIVYSCSTKIKLFYLSATITKEWKTSENDAV